MKRFIFWDYPRASFPYDIMVALILAFIFLAPAEIFGDRPKASSVAKLSSDLYFIGPQEMKNKPDAERLQAATELIRKRFRENVTVLKVEPQVGSESEVEGFIAYTKR